MKNIFVLFSSIILFLSFTGCIHSPIAPGAIYTNVKHSGIEAGIIDNNIAENKIGKSSCSNILGLFAFGDCSISKAQNSVNISKVHSVEHKSLTLLGFFSTYVTIVTGE